MTRELNLSTSLLVMAVLAGCHRESPQIPPGPKTSLVGLPFVATADDPGAVDMAGSVVPGGSMRVDVGVHTTREAFPKLRWNFSPPQDWRRYTALRLEMRISSPDTIVTEKRVGFIFYDAGLRHDNLPGKPPAQQGTGKVVPAGSWQKIEIPLAEYQRAEIASFEIYLYGTPPGAEHSFTAEFKSVELVGPPDSYPVLDSIPFFPSTRSRKAGGKPLSVSTWDGTAEIHLDPAGRIPGENELSGLLIREANSTPIPVAGQIRQEGSKIVQEDHMGKEGLSVRAEYAPSADRIDIRGSVEDLTGRERHVTVFFVLPVEGGGWDWADGISRSRKSVSREAPNFEFVANRYPIATISRDGKESHSLAIRMDEPSNFRFGFNPKSGSLFAAFDMALLPMERAAGGTLSRGDFHVMYFTSDPAWGFRAALQKYYDDFPQFFQRRVRNEGGWHLRTVPTEEQVAAGLTLQWEPTMEVARKSQAMGLNQLWYIEPEFFQLTLGDRTAPSLENALSRLRLWAKDDEQEYRKTRSLAYYSYHGNRASHRTLAEAVLASAVYNSRGLPDVEVRRGEWIGDSLQSAIFTCNLNPAIPRGLGTLNAAIIREKADASERAGVPAAGYALDSFLGFRQEDRWDYRAENFKYSSIQPGFREGKAAQFCPLESVEWLRSFAAQARADGRIIMLNNIVPGPGIMFAAPYADVIGIESSFINDPDFYRAIMGPKVLTLLTYEKTADWQHRGLLLHGVFPGGENDLSLMKSLAPLRRDLSSAGWHPITFARADDSRVRLERFGNRLVASNTADAPVDTIIRPDQKSLPGTPPELRLALAPRETKIIELEKPSHDPEAK